jgi:VCBS repeat-containing protein
VANDGELDSNLATVAITVNPVNDAPVAVDDSYSVNEDETLAIEAGGPLANDTDIDGDALTAVLVDNPAHGTVALAEDGSFQYTPNPDFYGSDSFTYVASDGELESNLATVAITVEPVNDAPVAGDDSYSVREGETLVVEASGPLANDTDIDSEALTAVLVDDPDHGAVTLAEDGSFQYTPDPDFHGTDRFTYAAHDGQLDSNPATVIITVTPIDLAIQLEVSDSSFGSGADVVWAGATFWVSAYVKDLSDVPQGVVGGAIDIVFDPLVVTPTGGVAYGEDFTAFQQGTPDAADGRIDESGALATISGVGVADFAAFVAWEFVPTGGPSSVSAGTHVQFAVQFGGGTETITPANFALVGSGEPVAWDQVALGTADVDLYFGDFNGDGLVNHFDLALWLPHADENEESPSYDPMYDLNADRLIDDLDLDLLTAAMYRPVTSKLAGPTVQPSGDSLDADTDATALAGNDLQPGDDLQAIDELFASDALWQTA